MNKVNALADKSVFNLDVGTRAISRLSNLNVDKELSPTSKDLLCDIFATLYQKQEFAAKTHHMVNKKILEYAETTNSLSNTRDTVGGNLFLVKATAPIMHSALMQDDMLKSALDEQQKAEELEEKAEEAQEKADNYPEDQQAQQKADEAKEKAKEAQEKAEETIDKLLDNPMTKAVVSSAVDKAEEEGTRIKTSVASWGLDNDQVNSSDDQQVDNLLKTLNNTTVQKLTDLLGRLNIMSMNTMANKNPSGYIPEGVEYTQDLKRVFKHELASMFDESILGTLKMVEYVDNGLLGWKYADSKENEGSFLCYIDKSGSMSESSRFDGCYYTNEQLATALGLSIALSANKTHDRKYTLKVFSDAVYPGINNDSTPSELFSWALNNPGGGTNMDKVIYDAINTVNTTYKDVDVDMVIITDEQFEVSDGVLKNFIEFKKSAGLRVLIVQIGYHSSSQVEDVADKVVNVSDLSNAGQLTSVIGGWIK